MMQTLKQHNSDFVVFELLFFFTLISTQHFCQPSYGKNIHKMKKLSEENFLIYYQINLNLLSYGTCTNHNIRLE